jgi:hypothetical protein
MYLHIVNFKFPRKDFMKRSSCAGYMTRKINQSSFRTNFYVENNYQASFGKYGKPFTIWTFTSMWINADVSSDH